MRFGILYFAVLLCGLLCLIALRDARADEGGATRIALISLGKDDQVVAAMELATASLSQQKGFVLLERARIGEVLREQSIAAFQDDGYQDLLRVGQLLRADIFVTLAKGSDTTVQRCIAFDVATGCRLIDVTLPAEQSPVLAESVTRATKEAISQHRLLSESNTRLIAFHGWRNVDLPSSYEPKFMAIRAQLEQQVSSAPGLVVLERARLRVVNDENRLPTSEFHARLLGSAIYIIPQFSLTSDKQGIDLTLVLRSTADEEETTLKQEFKPGHEMDAINALVEALRTTVISLDLDNPLISSKQANQQQSRRESVRLHAEAKRLQQSRDWSDAIAFYEASYAVDPNQVENLRCLIGLLDNRAHALRDPIRELSREQKGRTDALLTLWRGAFDLLEYRLDLIVLQHGKRKHEERWSGKVVSGRGGGGWPPWHESADLLRLIDRKRLPDVHRMAKQYCDRYLSVLYGEIAEYARKECKTNQALYTAIEMSHPRCNHLVADVSGRWPDLVFEEFDRWEAVMLSDRWQKTRQNNATPANRLLDLIEFKDYEHNAIDDNYAEAVRKRVQRVANNFPLVEIRAKLRLAELDMQYFGLEQPEQIEKQVLPILEKAFTQATRPLPENPPRSHSRFPGNNGPEPLDERRRFDLHLLKQAVSLLPDREQASRALFERLIAAGVFAPDLMRTYLPKEYNQSVNVIPEALRTWLLACRNAREQLQKHRKQFTATDFDAAVEYLDWRVTQIQSGLAKHENIGIRFWSELHLIEGMPKWPECYKEREELRLVGRHLRGRNLYYILSLRSAKDSQGVSRRNWQVKRLALESPFTPTLVATLRDVPRLRDLPPELREAREAQSESPAPHALCQLAADDKNLYAVHSGFGIVVLPLQGGEPWTLDEGTGLPSNFVHSVAEAEGKLYAWVGRPKKEMLLVSFDPASRAVDVLISSQRVDKKHSFSELQPDVVSFLYHDEPRQRLLFFAHRKLWQYDLSTKAVVPWVELTRSNTVGHPDCLLSVDSIRVADSNQELMVNRGRAFWIIDLATGTHRRVPDEGSFKQYPNGNPCAWRGDYLWLDSWWQAYDPATNTCVPLEEPFPVPEYWYNGWRTCEIDSQSRYAVVSGIHHLWIAELAEPLLVELPSDGMDTGTESDGE